MPIYSLDHVFEHQTDQLVKQVMTAQFFGGTLLIAPAAVWLPGQFMMAGLISGGVVCVYTLAFWAFWHRDRVYGRPIPPRLRLDQLRNSLGPLVSIDSAVILALIGSTGGVAHSHLTGVLLLIPCVMSIVTIKPRVFVCIAMALVVILITGLLSYGIVGWDPLVVICGKLGLSCGESSGYPGYPYAVSAVAVLGIVLIVLEKRVIKPQWLTDKWSFNEIVNLSPKHEYDSFLADHVNRAFRRYRRCLDETNIPDPHISLVHNPQAAFSQAYILAYPSYRIGKSDDAEDVAFVTFASHWIDDCFDAIYAREILDEVTEEEMEELTLQGVCERMQGIGIDKMVQHVLHSAKDKELVEAGLFRVMLAGLIQRAPVDIRDELEKLYRDIYKNKEKLDRELGEKVDRLKISLLLATARTSFGLILGCESPRESQERSQLDSYACLFDLILCPLVLFHDLATERRWEGGTLPPSSGPFLDDLIDAAKLAVEKLPDYIDEDSVPGHVRAKQLEILRDLYLDLLPGDGTVFKEGYTKHLNEFIERLAKGRHSPSSATEDAPSQTSHHKNLGTPY